MSNTNKHTHPPPPITNKHEEDEIPAWCDPEWREIDALVDSRPFIIQLMLERLSSAVARAVNHCPMYEMSLKDVSGDRAAKAYEDVKGWRRNLAEDLAGIKCAILDTLQSYGYDVPAAWYLGLVEDQIIFIQDERNLRAKDKWSITAGVNHDLLQQLYDEFTIAAHKQGIKAKRFDSITPIKIPARSKITLPDGVHIEKISCQELPDDTKPRKKKYKTGELLRYTVLDILKSNTHKDKPIPAAKLYDLAKEKGSISTRPKSNKIKLSAISIQKKKQRTISRVINDLTSIDNQPISRSGNQGYYYDNNNLA